MANERERWEHLIPKTYYVGGNTDREGEEKKASVRKRAQVDVSGVSPAGVTPSGGGVFFTRPVDYRPEFASPDRWSIPENIEKRMQYWRLFFMVDPLISSTIDIYCEMPISDYSLVGDGVEGSVKETFEEMLDELNFLFMLKSLMVEYLVVGEAVIHLVYDKGAGIFVDWNMFKPENIEVVDLSLVGLEPAVVYKPESDFIKELTKFGNVIEQVYDTRDLPGLNMNFINELITKKSFTFDPLNCAYIPRLLHPYDKRGVSLIMRLWRVLMYEDAVMNATLQTAKRHAAPVKTFSMGDLGAGFVPTQAQVDGLLRALAQAEADPHAWIHVPPGTRFEAWGTTDRVLGIGKEYEVIERMKLIGLGVSRDFVLGTSTFASAQASLQVFVSRLLAFRLFFEEVFIYPKLFKTIAKVHQFRKPTRAELEHKTINNSERGYIVPKIRWSKSFRPEANVELLEVYEKLKRDFDIVLSHRTVSSAAGIHWEEEVRKHIQEMGIINLVRKLEKGEEVNRDEFGRAFEGIGIERPMGLESIAPPPEVISEPKELKMHASNLDDRVRIDAELEERLKKLGLVEEDNEGSRMLVGSGVAPGRMAKKMAVNKLDGEAIRDRLERGIR